MEIVPTNGKVGEGGIWGFNCLKGGGTTDGRAMAGGYTSTRRMRRETGVHKNEQVAHKQGWVDGVGGVFWSPDAQDLVGMVGFSC